MRSHCKRVSTRQDTQDRRGRRAPPPRLIVLVDDGQPVRADQREAHRSVAPLLVEHEDVVRRAGHLKDEGHVVRGDSPRHRHRDGVAPRVERIAAAPETFVLGKTVGPDDVELGHLGVNSAGVDASIRAYSHTTSAYSTLTVWRAPSTSATAYIDGHCELTTNTRAFVKPTRRSRRSSSAFGLVPYVPCIFFRA